MTFSTIVPIVGALLLSLLAAECLTYGTKFGLFMVNMGVRLLPPDLQGDLGEEWRRHVTDLGDEGHQLSAMLWGFHSLNAALKISARTGGSETDGRWGQRAEAFLRTVAVLSSVGGVCTVSALALINAGSTNIPIGAMLGLWLLYALWFLDIAYHRPKDPPSSLLTPSEVKNIHRRQLASVLVQHVNRGETFEALSQRFGLEPELIVSLIRSYEDSKPQT